MIKYFYDKMDIVKNNISLSSILEDNKNKLHEKKPKKYSRRLKDTYIICMCFTYRHPVDFPFEKTDNHHYIFIKCPNCNLKNNIK